MTERCSIVDDVVKVWRDVHADLGGEGQQVLVVVLPLFHRHVGRIFGQGGDFESGVKGDQRVCCSIKNNLNATLKKVI